MSVARPKPRQPDSSFNPKHGLLFVWRKAARDALILPCTTLILPCTMLMLALMSTGCVGSIYAIKANTAASKLQQAKTLRADELAEYEYYYSQQYLLKAQEEAAQAEYGDAIEFAGVAAEYATKAIQLSRDAHGAAGR